MRRILLILNRSSATGPGIREAKRLVSILRDSLGEGTNIVVEVVADHPQARRLTRAFVSLCDAPALVVAGGGSGTLRAVVEGICDGSKPGLLPGPDRILVASLRMGSGNPVAKQLGVPKDPEEAVRGLAMNLYEGRAVRCCVMRWEVGRKDCRPDVRHAVTLVGFGQFGRCPADLEMWHQKLKSWRKVVARLLPIERINDAEYAVSLITRLLWCCLHPNTPELVEVHSGQGVQPMKLLAGTVMNFPIKHLPFHPGVDIQDAEVSLNFMPYSGCRSPLQALVAPQSLAKGAVQIQLFPHERVEIRLLDRPAAHFFLDEDPDMFYESTSVQIAGTLAFVPGPGYSRTEGDS